MVIDNFAPKGAWTLDSVGGAINISLLMERKAASEFIHAYDKSLRHEKSANNRTDHSSDSFLLFHAGCRAINDAIGHENRSDPAFAT